MEVFRQPLIVCLLLDLITTGLGQNISEKASNLSGVLAAGNNSLPSQTPNANPESQQTTQLIQNTNHGYDSHKEDTRRDRDDMLSPVIISNTDKTDDDHGSYLYDEGDSGFDEQYDLTSLDFDFVDFEEEEEEEDDDNPEENKSLPVEQRLMNKLMRNYERSVRPVFNASDVVIVRMGLTLTQIFDMDEKDQVLVTNVWLDQEWDDTFLKWDPEEYDNLTVLRLPCHKIWLPDIVLYNNAAEYTDGLMPANAMITHEGNVFWPVPTKLLSTCKVDVTYFPFDNQSCRLKFGSWTYDGFQVDMTNRTTVVDLSNYVSNGEWELVDIVIERNVVYYACCEEPFPDVTFIIYIRRRTLYYLYNIIFPCVMMSALTLLVFCLPPDSGEKITLGITVLLAFSVFLLRMGEDLPETSEFIPLLSIYLTIVMAMTSVSVIMTVFVLNLHHRGPDGSPVPKWLRNSLLSSRKSRGIMLTRGVNDAGDEEYYYQPRCGRKTSLKMTVENLAKELKDELDQNCTSDFASESMSTAGTEQFTELREMTVMNSCQRQRAGTYTPLVAQGEQQQPRTNTEILKALHRIIERYDREDCDAIVSHEWRRIANIVDRVLFWVFFTGTLSSTVVVLVIAPLVKL